MRRSLAQYEQALETDPTSADAAFGYAMTLIHLQRYDEARGRRAKSLAEELLKHEQTADLAETLAMALAEVGQYAEAAALQRHLAAAAAWAGRSDLVPRLNATLELYERGKPNRTFWEDEEWE